MPPQLTGILKVNKFIFRALLKNKFFAKIDENSNWREKIFKKIILYATPLSLIALVPSLIILLNNGYQFLSVFDIFVLISIPPVALSNHIKLTYKKAYVVFMLYTLAIIKTDLLASFAIGAIYLLALSVFISLLFSRKAIIGSVITNVFIYLSFGFVIYFKLFNSHLIGKYTLDFWIFHTSNFLFLNLAIVVIIRHIIIRLEKTISQQVSLRATLQNEIQEKNLLNGRLIESVGHYKRLFFGTLSPMWIFDSKTLKFIQVNGAAIKKYGYTRAEFWAMTIKDIRPAEDVDDLLQTLEKTGTKNGSTVSTVKHKCKNGRIIYAEVRCSNIIFQGKIERLVISRDITEQIQHTKAIEKQNEQLHEIAYLQSHVVRAPLCRILGLVNMLKISEDIKSEHEILQYLDTSAKELDEVIRTIINKTEEVDPSNS